jgi:hypothetical protein
MVEGLEALTGEYYGWLIFLGRTLAGDNVVALAGTGRRQSSQERILYRKKDGTIKAFPTDLTTKIDFEGELSKEAKDEIREKGGNPALLIYNAIMDTSRCEGVVVSNGAQTDLLARGRYRVSDSGLSGVLAARLFLPEYAEGIDLTSPEPDPPNNTPRIFGVQTGDEGALGIIRREPNGTKSKSFFEFPLVKGKGKVLPTYSGRNVPKGVAIPSFRGEPIDIDFVGDSPEDIARGIYAALGPKYGEGLVSPEEDFRVSVAVAFYDPFSDERLNDYIINRKSLEVK